MDNYLIPLVTLSFGKPGSIVLGQQEYSIILIKTHNYSHPRLIFTIGHSLVQISLHRILTVNLFLHLIVNKISKLCIEFEEKKTT